ncbi:alpha-ribazole phosphatase [Larkinella harenae]
MEIHLIRHTTPAVAPGLIYGRTEVDLLNSFPDEVAQIRNKLPARLDAWYSSPSRRCTQLAEQLAPAFMIDDRLCEFHFGDWEGKTWDTVDPNESKAWMDDYVNVCSPNGESMVQMNERVTAFWAELIRLPYQTAGIVTHGGVIRLLLAADQKLPLATVFSLKVDYGAVVQLRTP